MGCLPNALARALMQGVEHRARRIRTGPGLQLSSVAESFRPAPFFDRVRFDSRPPPYFTGPPVDVSIGGCLLTIPINGKAIRSVVLSREVGKHGLAFDEGVK